VVNQAVVDRSQGARHDWQLSKTVAACQLNSSDRLCRKPLDAS
jgi:hypothetical protein